MISIGRTTEVVLGTIRDYLSKIFNGRTCIGYQKVTLSSNTTVVSLTVPAGATSAEITVETADTTTSNASVRYTFNPVAPTASIFAVPGSGAVTLTGTPGGNGYIYSGEGIPLGDFDTVEILGYNNLQAFTAIQVTTSGNRYLKVQYFK